MKLTFGIFCIFFLIVLSNSAKKQRPSRKQKKEPVSTFVSIKDYPYAVGLIKLYERNPIYLCSGAIIARQFVLTAAHCIYSQNVQHAISLGKVVVRGGGTNIRGGTGYDHRIYGYTIHKEYNDTDRINDIALIQVKDHLNNTFEEVVEVATYNYKYSQEAVFVVGWGRTTDDDTTDSAEKLRTTKTTLLDKCTDYFWQWEFVGWICSRPIGALPYDELLIQNKTLIGYQSFYRISVNTVINVNARIAWYDEWINTSMKSVDSLDR